MLTEKYSGKIYNSLLPVELIRPYPSCEIRKEWDRLPKYIIDLILKRSARHMETESKPLKGTVILDFLKNGNPDYILNSYTEKLSKLTALALLECTLDESTYTEKILDTAWAVFDMAMWHLPDTDEIKANGISYDVTIPVLDSYSTGMGFTMAYVYYLLKDRFDAIDINIGKRFQYELDKRIMKPFLDGAEMKSVDCLGNILFAFLIFKAPYKTRHRAVRESMVQADRYLEQIESGRVSGLSIELIKYLDLLDMSTDGVFDYDSNKLAEYSIASTPSEDIRLLQYIGRTANQNVKEHAYRECSGAGYISRIGEDIPIDQSLFLIFSRDLITSGFYIETTGTGGNS